MDREATEGTAQELSAVELTQSGSTRSTTSAPERHPVLHRRGSRSVMILRTASTSNIGPAIAGLGVVGVAVGFGVQHLVRDYLNGALILIENQSSKGDVIRVGGVSGTVEDFSLRRTTLRDLDGVVHTVPNGEITIASNLTRVWSAHQPGRHGCLRNRHRQGDRGRRRRRQGDGRRTGAMEAARPRGAARRSRRRARREYGVTTQDPGHGPRPGAVGGGGRVPEAPAGRIHGARHRDPAAAARRPCRPRARRACRRRTRPWSGVEQGTAWAASRSSPAGEFGPACETALQDWEPAASTRAPRPHHPAGAGFTQPPRPHSNARFRTGGGRHTYGRGRLFPRAANAPTYPALPHPRHDQPHRLPARSSSGTTSTCTASSPRSSARSSSRKGNNESGAPARLARDLRRGLRGPGPSAPRSSAGDPGDIIGRKFDLPRDDHGGMGVSRPRCVGVLPTYAQIGILAADHPGAPPPRPGASGPRRRVRRRGHLRRRAQPGAPDRGKNTKLDPDHPPRSGLLLGPSPSSCLLSSRTSMEAGRRTSPQLRLRIPFLLSAVLVVLALFIRLRLQETPLFARLRGAGQVDDPLAVARELRQRQEPQPSSCWRSSARPRARRSSGSQGQFPGALFFLGTNPRRQVPGCVPGSSAWRSCSATPFFYFFGRLSDRVGRKRVILAGWASSRSHQLTTRSTP